MGWVEGNSLPTEPAAIVLSHIFGRAAIRTVDLKNRTALSGVRLCRNIGIDDSYHLRLVFAIMQRDHDQSIIIVMCLLSFLS